MKLIRTQEWVRPIFKYLGRQLVMNDEVKLAGCGTFRKICKMPRTGRHAITGEKIDIPAKISVEFIPERGIKQALEELPPREDLYYYNRKSRYKKKRAEEQASSLDS